MDKIKRPLRVALYAMNERSIRTMAMYLQGPCKGVAVVVDEASADIDIFDGDSHNAKQLLAEHAAKPLPRPIIVLSLQSVKLDNVILVKKPVKAEDMLGALAEVKARLEQQARQARTNQQPNNDLIANDVADEQPVLKKYARNTDAQNKGSKHQTAMQLNEAAFNAYIGVVPGVDVNDPAQFAKAAYNPKDYFQDYIQFAINTSHEKGENLQLHTGWRQVVLFPQSRKIWLDADDKLLRAFANVKVDRLTGQKMQLSPFKANLSTLNEEPEKFHNLDAFLWKVACWTSKGRYPDAINLEHPVYLKNWPNFTRLLITPHAMRIAALLVQEPKTVEEIIKALNIKPQYVFVFISAAYALGLVGQARREADELVQASVIVPSKKKGLLGRIISKLRGSNA
jgi:hypothetical protein